MELLIRPRGEAAFRPLATVNTGRDGVSTHRTSLASGAQYRYRWTPLPTLEDPLPVPRESGIVDLGRRESSRVQGLAGAVKAGDDPAAFYTAGYSLADREESLKLGRWRELGARTKAAHAVRCAGRRRRRWSRSAAARARCWPSSHAAWPQARFDGFELSAPAIEIARSRGIPRAGRLEAFDGARVPADDGAYDLAVLSHVLEHVPDPLPLLREAARVARRVLVEVPLEGNRSAAGRPTRRVRADRAPAPFDRRECARSSPRPGWGSRRAERPAPARASRLLRRGRPARAAAALKWALRTAVWKLAPEGGEKWFTLHYALVTGPSHGEVGS